MKNKNILKSFYHAFSGLFSCLKTERNLKIHVSVMILVIIFGLILKISASEWLTCLIFFAMVIGAELFNTSLEETVNLACPKIYKTAKIAKDASAAAVLVFAIFSVIAGLIIFLPKIILILK